MESSSENSLTPNFFDLLSESDQKDYYELRNSFTAPNCRNRRGKRLETFTETLDSIKSYAVRHQSDDWKRCLVCGVCWLDNSIAINIRQLTILVNKCKSSINGSLHKMGYFSSTSHSDTNNALVTAIPLLNGNFPELRQWTIRQLAAVTPQPEIPHYSYSMSSLISTPAPSIPYYPHKATPVLPSLSSSISQPTLDIATFQDSFTETPSFDYQNDDDIDEFCLPLTEWGTGTNLDSNQNNDMNFPEL